MRRLTLQMSGVIAVLALIIVVIVVDIHTSLWQELVILSGLVAGVITFLLTTFFIDRILQRSQRARQAPLRRLALVELLHALADDNHSQLMRGILRVRQLPDPTANHSKELSARVESILAQASDERKTLAQLLGVWAGFLTSTDHYEELVQQIADNALELERVQEAAVALEEKLVGGAGHQTELAELAGAVTRANAGIRELADQLEQALLET